ncbi:MAG: C40 family peptidase [Kiloniellaceae bacterium]
MTVLDPRLNAYRSDLAAASLEGRIEAARFVTGRPAQVACGVADLRRAPAPTAPLDSQLLFGETVTVYDRAGGWAWVQNGTDDYVGYVSAVALAAQVAPATHTVGVPRTFLYPEPDLKAPPLDALSLMSRVSVTGQQARFAEIAVGATRGWVYAAHLAAPGQEALDYVATALAFLGVPYLWGGRSSLGLDCSALVQLALARAGQPCPRDTAAQAGALGEAIEWRPGQSVPRRGDLVFFPGHVAIALDGSRVVHTNAGAMLTAIESLAGLEARVKDETGGTGITGLRRLSVD